MKDSQLNILRQGDLDAFLLPGAVVRLYKSLCFVGLIVPGTIPTIDNGLCRLRVRPRVRVRRALGVNGLQEPGDALINPTDSFDRGTFSDDSQPFVLPNAHILEIDTYPDVRVIQGDDPSDWVAVISKRPHDLKAIRSMIGSASEQ